MTEEKEFNLIELEEMVLTVPSIWCQTYDSCKLPMFKTWHDLTKSIESFETPKQDWQLQEIIALHGIYGENCIK